MTQDTPYAVAFSHILGIGPMTYQLILNAFDSPKKAYEDTGPRMQKIVGPKLFGEYMTWKSKNDPITLVDRLVKRNIQIVEYGSSEYPDQIGQLRDPAICLYGFGDMKLLKDQRRIFGIVGTRMASSYGRFIAESIARDLSRHFVIVSGLALGIDSVAHRATLDARGKTIAVLGCGVDIVYPAEHRALYTAIIKSGGVVISEFPPGMTVQRGLFVARNRIVSGLGVGVLVVEGAINSGSLITAKYAAEQGRDVFAVPADVTSAMGKGPNMLLKEGAIMTTSAEDIYNYYSLSSTASRERTFEDPRTARLVDTLRQEPMTVDALSSLLETPLSETLLLVSELELDGVVQRQSDGLYYLI